ncbi:subtilase [Colletotrichum graminicola M1.001]|uniref:Subtilase n=1 Tax=Colletotrichum graminicola (strain M1.001 / M2 / FGSC 10212) TaxID=645133 RepID=E3QLE4_COLGM|nr:subtilase [Colletotrichum graminicola M1.001]EFQ31682.1 subtilase [Colletotrichum graminicola M1.001]
MLAVAEDPTQKADFETFLAPFAQPGTMKDLSKEFDSPEDLGIYVLLTTEDNAAIIRKDPRVLSIDLDVDSGFDEPSTAAPDQSEQITLDTFDGFVIQTPSQDALGDLSLPLPVNVQGFTPSNVPGYAYQQEAGKGVTVYVLDTGANPAHDDFAKAEGNKRWLFASEDTAEDDKNGHGSCVQSLVNGPLFGVAKAADIVIVKLGARFTLDNILFGLLLVYQDVIKNKLQGKAVVNMSLGSQLLVPSTNNQGKNPGFILPQAIAGYNSTIQLLIDEDVVVVAASGNSRDEPGGSEFVTAFPAFLGRQLNMIAVGAVTAEGKREDYSQGVPRELDTSAVGTTVCASNLGNADVEKTGTSMSAPLVSGMIAVWLSSAQYRARLQVPGQVAANVKQLVRELSYNRFGGGDTPVAWNGVDVFTCNSGISGSAKLRARAGQCVINSTSTALPTASPPPQPPSATVPVVVSTMTPPPPAQTPLPCYNFNVDAYGYCCATADSPCGDGVGTCWLPFTGVGVGGGGDGINLLPTGARCPPPPGAKDDF